MNKISRAAFVLLFLFAGRAEALPDSSNPEDWYERARADLEVAQLVSDETTRYEVVCFQAHQAVEKSLKGALWGKGIDPGKTHLTARLLGELAESRPELLSLEPNARVLDLLYTASRYPKPGIVIDSARASDCLAQARPLVAAIQEGIQSKKGT